MEITSILLIFWKTYNILVISHTLLKTQASSDSLSLGTRKMSRHYIHLWDKFKKDLYVESTKPQVSSQQLEKELFTIANHIKNWWKKFYIRSLKENQKFWILLNIYSTNIFDCLPHIRKDITVEKMHTTFVECGLHLGKQKLKL